MNPLRRAQAAAVAALLTLAVGSCGDGDDSNEMPDGSVVWPDAGVCLYSIAVTPFQPLLGDTVTLEVRSTGACVPRAGSYTWTVTAPGGQGLTPLLRQDGRLAEVVPDLAGSHHVEVELEDLRRGRKTLQRTVVVNDPAAALQSYLLRLTPPTGVHAPRQQQLVLVYGATAVEDRVFTLGEGITITNQLLGPQGAFGGYLRLTEAGYAMVKEVRVPATGQFEVAALPDALYGAIVVPEGASPAPTRLAPRPVPELLAAGAFTLDAGLAVVGYVEDASALPIGQARAVLRTEGVPSSVGQSELFYGRFVLWARPGDHALEVAPPEGTPLPQVWVPAASGLVLPPDGAMELRLRYRPFSVVEVSARVVGPGDVPVPGARVTFEATDLGAVATLTATLDGSPLATVDATGACRRAAETDAFGQLPPLALPAGTYSVLVEVPADAPSGIGTTLLPGVIVGAPAGTQTLVLAVRAPVLLEGWVVDESLSPVADVSVVAITRLGVGSAVEGRTEPNGAFRLEVIGGATYDVQLVPPLGSGLARGRVEAFHLASQGPTLLAGLGPFGEVILPRGLRLSGTVVFQSDGLGGVLVQAIPADRPDAPVLAETVTDAAGQFELVVPDPGVME